MEIHICWVDIVVGLGPLAQGEPLAHRDNATLEEGQPPIDAELCPLEVVGQEEVCLSEGERLEVVRGGMIQDKHWRGRGKQQSEGRGEEGGRGEG